MKDDDLESTKYGPLNSVPVKYGPPKPAARYGFLLVLAAVLLVVIVLLVFYYR